jgi:hypothetical protein
VILGGFVFNTEGLESDQLDVIVITNKCPQFNMHNPDGTGKSFSAVEGTAAVISLKSDLDGDQLVGALKNLASIPEFIQEGRSHADLPFKMIYAPAGLSATTIKKHLETFYADNPDIPSSKRVDLIHVLGKFVISRVQVLGQRTAKDEYFEETDANFGGLPTAVAHINRAVYGSTVAGYNFALITRKVIEECSSAPPTP